MSIVLPKQMYVELIKEAYHAMMTNNILNKLEIKSIYISISDMVHLLDNMKLQFIFRKLQK